MLNVNEINNTIEELENSNTTFDTCIKLAALYTVREHLKQPDTVTQELDDILPKYQLYREVKRKYQLHELAESAVQLSIRDVCIEIKEFIQSLYSSSDMEEERIALNNMITELFEAL